MTTMLMTTDQLGGLSLSFVSSMELGAVVGEGGQASLLDCLLAAGKEKVVARRRDP
jgi:hypothetical protein